MNIDEKALQAAKLKYGLHTLLQKIHENDRFVLYNSYQPEYKETGHIKYINNGGEEITLANKQTEQIYFHHFMSPEGNLLNYFSQEELERDETYSNADWYNELKDWGVVEKNLIFHIISLIGYEGSISPSPYPFDMGDYYLVVKEHFGTFDFERESETKKTSLSYIQDFIRVLDKFHLSYEEDNSSIKIKKISGTITELRLGT